MRDYLFTCARDRANLSAWLSTGPITCFLAVGALGEVLVWSSKANTTIYATAVSHRLEPSKESNTLLGHF